MTGVALAFIKRSGYTAAVELLEYEDLLMKPPSEVREALQEGFRAVVEGRPRERAFREMLARTGIEKRHLIEKAASWLTGSG